MKALICAICLTALSYAHAFELKEIQQPLIQLIELKSQATGVFDTTDSVSKLSVTSEINDALRQDRGDSWDRDVRRERVYCGYYRDNRVSGYSIYRTRNHQDIGNAVWPRDRYECDEAASLANRVREGIVCAKYHHRSSGNTVYSVYRIRDNTDLGKATISNFHNCQAAVRSARHGIFCSTYVQNGRTYWSPYDIQTGRDLGRSLYASLDQCERAY